MENVVSVWQDTEKRCAAALSIFRSILINLFVRGISRIAAAIRNLSAPFSNYLTHFRSNEADNFILGQHFIGRSKETLINKPIELRG